MRRLLAVVVLAALTECSPATMPSLSMKANPTSIDDRGQVTELTITATDARGEPGKGAVKVTSVAGSLRQPETVTLDEKGKATVGFSCVKATDALCTDRVRVVAEWQVNGEVVAAEVRVPFTVEVPDLNVDWDPSASTAPCLSVDAGASSACFADGGCARGFTCVYDISNQKQCVLKGGTGDVQVTLRFRAPVDLDLHVWEPKPDAGSACHMFFADRGPMNSCGSVGSLDLDTNAACDFDRVDTENIIYPSGRRAPKGEYRVDVDYWSSCTIQQDVPYQIEVRAGRQTRYWCGAFTPAMDGDQVPVTRFVIRP